MFDFSINIIQTANIDWVGHGPQSLQFIDVFHKRLRSDLTTFLQISIIIVPSRQEFLHKFVFIAEANWKWLDKNLNISQIHWFIRSIHNNT